jgi:high-affinity iron transporter
MALPRVGCRAVAPWIATALLWAATAHAVTSGGDAARADVQRALTLLNVVAEEYREGVVDGRVVLPVEYGEATTFLDEAQARLRAAAPPAAAAADPSFASVRAALQERAPLERVRSGLEQIRAAIAQTTGIVEEVYPAAAPSAAHGHALFAENCTPCHGERANGGGPDAARLEPRPANFTDPAFMRRETPFSFFNIISAGKSTSAMPAWADVFSLQERWDLVSFLYSVEPGDAGLAEGQTVYRSRCASCHGAAGEGGGAATGGARQPAPPLNRLAALAQKTDEELFAAAAHGASPTPAGGAPLSDEARWAVVSYVRQLSLGGSGSSAVAEASGAGERRFAGLLRVLGDTYRKAVVPGASVDQLELTESGILLDQVLRQAPSVQDVLREQDPTAAAALAEQVDSLAAAVRARRPAAEVVAIAAPLAAAIEARLPAASQPGQPSDQEQLAEARRLLDRALADYRAGDARAAYHVSDAYFLFDPLEKRLALADAGLAQRAEARFGELRGVMQSPGHEREAASLVTALGADLDAARTALVPRQGGLAIAFQSAFIVLREGFEVVLIVGALLAYAAKAGAPAMRRPILWGTAAGAAASLLTAYALVRLFEASGATGDVLEGATMLLASAVLFFVSYWLISKAEADRWQRYIQGKVKSALATGNAAALGGAAFLAVYREGTETVLFYQALIDSAPGALTAVVLGVAAGGLGLAILYALYTHLGARLPLRQFFFVTGSLLYYLAVVFAGKGVAELQAAGWIGTTPVAWVPRVDLLGLYPTVETLAAQGALLLCVLYAIVVTVRRARRDEAQARRSSFVPRISTD